ncbi:hypothetical protein ABZ707_22380 [Streptomyces sp. NPDC006923]|uniref:DUF7848 domain-containing protein n=1 Tax=Streptomyces sp. NPDC006923 TaxID=3155355 RepID=UPI0033F0F62F
MASNQQAEPHIEIGSVMRDTNTGRIGVVQRGPDGLTCLRALSDDDCWEVDANALSSLTSVEMLSARVALTNYESRCRPKAQPAIVRHVRWTLTPDQEPDAEPSTYSMQCVVCSAGSERSEGWQEPQDWALGHSGRNPAHHTFRENITRPWRTFMRT